MNSLSRRFGSFTAVDDVSFAIPEGQVVGLLGPNGAGKTTLLRMMTGALTPTSGSVQLGGVDMWRDPLNARRQVGYLPENVALYREMRVTEYLSFRAQLQFVERSATKGAIENALARCLLRDVAHQVIGTLSKGYRQRVGLAAAILHQPKVLILDEPTVGLDPKQMIAIRELIRELGSDQTLLVSTHVLPEVERLCDRILIFDRGRLAAEGSAAALRARWTGSSALRVEIHQPSGAAAEDPVAVFGALAEVESVAKLEGEGSRWALSCRAGMDGRESVFRTCVERQWTLLEMTREDASLEQIFVRLTTQDEVSQKPEDA